eukprot:286791_1
MFTLETFPYFQFVIASTIGVHLWETYLNLRQRNKLNEKEPSSVLLENKLTTTSDFTKSQTYGLDKNTFGLFKDFINLIETIIFISYGYLYFWNFSNKLCNKLLGSSSIYYQSLLFIISYQLFEIIISIPFNYYSHFVIEEKHGFNKQTLSIFIKDIIKQFGISVIIISILIPIMIWIFDYFGDNFVIYLWIFLSLFMLLLMWLAPNVIMPCFYKFETLNEEKHCTNDKLKGLKGALDALADGLAFPLKKIYIMDGSTRSSHSNAFQYGFCNNKRIVLFDTLLNQMSKEEISSVMCHELGHWQYSHTLKGLFITEIQLFVMFILFKIIYANKIFYSNFGFIFNNNNEPAIIIGLILFSHLLSPISVVLNFLQNYLTRSWEYQADEFAVKLNHGNDLYNALVVLFKENKSKLDPDQLYEAYHHNHPSALPRLNALKKFQAKQEQKAK